jgi:hypothetical protein
MIAELLSVLKGQRLLLRELSERWVDAFAGDEEAFAEDLARHLAQGEHAQWSGWAAFLVDFGSGLKEVLQ